MIPMIVMLALACQATAGVTEEPAQSGRLVLVAGRGTGGDGTPADRAELIAPFGVAFDSEDTLIFVELTGNRVRKIGPDALVTTLAGTGQGRPRR